jgi:hypothetical protein
MANMRDNPSWLSVKVTKLSLPIGMATLLTLNLEGCEGCVLIFYFLWIYGRYV